MGIGPPDDEAYGSVLLLSGYGSIAVKSSLWNTPAGDASLGVALMKGVDVIDRDSTLDDTLMTLNMVTE